MSDFDKREWMDDNAAKSGTVWHSMRAHRPLPEYCDIRLKDGTEIGPCWPSKGGFVDLSSEDDTVHPFSEVTHVCYYELSDDDEDEDEDGEDDDDV